MSLAALSTIRAPFREKLRESLQLIFVDHRGFVPPPRSVDNHAFDLDLLLDDIESVRKKAAAREIHYYRPFWPWIYGFRICQKVF